MLQPNAASANKKAPTAAGASTHTHYTLPPKKLPGTQLLYQKW
jgi:hypothetical protein